MTRLDDAVDLLEHRSTVTGRQGVDRRVQQRTIGETQQRGSTGVGEPVIGRTGDQLVEHRERVTDRPTTGTRDEREDSRLHGHALGRAEALHVLGQPRRRNQTERVVVGARTDRADDLLRLGGREDELHVLRRFLDDLQQRVEALRRHHVRLVDDVDLEPALRRAVGRTLAQVASVVDTSVAGRVDLDDVDRAGSLARQRNTRLAGAARRGRRPLLAVEAAGQDARAGRLAAAARTAEQVGVVDPPRAQGLHQRLGDVLLPDHIGERLRAVTTVEGCAHPVTLCRRTDSPHRSTQAGDERQEGEMKGPVGHLKEQFVLWRLLRRSTRRSYLADGSSRPASVCRLRVPGRRLTRVPPRHRDWAWARACSKLLSRPLVW